MGLSLPKVVSLEEDLSHRENTCSYVSSKSLSYIRTALLGHNGVREGHTISFQNGLNVTASTLSTAPCRRDAGPVPTGRRTLVSMGPWDDSPQAAPKRAERRENSSADRRLRRPRQQFQDTWSEFTELRDLFHSHQEKHKSRAVRQEAPTLLKSHCSWNRGVGCRLTDFHLFKPLQHLTSTGLNQVCVTKLKWETESEM